jgi:hypothetical protein
MARFLRPRGFGDVDMEAIAMVALLGTFGPRERPAGTIDAAAHIVGQGFAAVTRTATHPLEP